MSRMYPILTDGKKFYHGDELGKPRCRFVYFTNFGKDTWKRSEKKKLERALTPKQAYERYKNETK